MILTDRTIKILKNCADINPSIVINKGSKIKTVDVQKNILLHADVDEVFPCEVWICDLKHFVDLCQNTMKGANIEFLPTFLNSDVTYEGVAGTLLFRKGIHEYFFRICKDDCDYIVKPENDIPDFETLGSFDLLNDVFQPLLINAKKSKGIAKTIFYDLYIYGCRESNSIYAECKNNLDNQRVKIANNLNTDNWFLENTKRNLVLKTMNCKFLPSDYKVTFLEGFCHFQSTDGYLKYWVALERVSNYE